MGRLNIEHAMGINITMDICGILMENGADISRIEEAAKELCTIFGISQTGLLVIPSFITITYFDEKNTKRTASCRLKEGGTNLSRIEGACSLISRLRDDNSLTLTKVYEMIEGLKKKTSDRWYKRLAIYAGVAGIFTTIFMGADIIDLSWLGVLIHIMGAAFCAAIVFIVDVLLARARISDIFAKMLSAVMLVLAIYISDHLLAFLKYEYFYSWYILMGNIMLIVPGIKFTNGVRDLFTGDVASATIHVVEAVFGTIGIVLGVLLMKNVLSYGLLSFVPAKQLIESPIWFMWVSVIMTGFGTMCFSMYFRIDIRHIWLSFLAGSITWLVYFGVSRFVGLYAIGVEAHGGRTVLSVIIEKLSGLICGNTTQIKGGLMANVFIPNCCAALIATILSESLAHSKRIPSTIFLFPAIVSLIPGGSLYKALDSIINANDASLVAETLYAAGGISCGIFIVAAMSRLWVSLIDAIDSKSGRRTQKELCIMECVMLKEEADRFYKLASEYMQYNVVKAYDFYKIANIKYNEILGKINLQKDVHSLNYTSMGYEIHLGAGINLFWMYKCAMKSGKTEEAKAFLEEANNQYKAAEIEVLKLEGEDEQFEFNQKNCMLKNWLAVMRINMARVEQDEQQWKTYIDEANELLKEALGCNPYFAKAYLNQAEVLFTCVAHELSVTYDQQFEKITKKNIPNYTLDRIESWFKEIEKNLQTMLIYDPEMINAYYKMGQLYAYRILVKTVFLGQDIQNTLNWQKEAEKWFMQASIRDHMNVGYLNTYQNYLQLVDKDRAVLIDNLKSKRKARFFQ